MITLPAPGIIDGAVAYKVMLDLTVYLAGPTVAEFEYLVGLYESVCPQVYRTKYSISELLEWQETTNPKLTNSGRIAAEAGDSRPYLEPIRQRIRANRAFDLTFWDGLEIGDSGDGWSFRCCRVHLRSSGLHAYVRIVIPPDESPRIIHSLASSIAENVELHSGHGGLVFSYNPWLKEAALDGIYANARRFWGIDIEELTQTLTLMKDKIKGCNWVTVISRNFADNPEIASRISGIHTSQTVNVEKRKHGVVIVAGPGPVAGDQHRADQELLPYYEVAAALEPIFLESHPDFSSERFVENGNTIGWIRRFIEPDGWR